MWGREPLAGTITERPTGITFDGGSPCLPTRGWSTRVNWPGGSFPMSRRTSCPRSSSAAAWSSACSTTAPQDDPTVYHLFYADELGSPGADITFFEYPGVPRGRAGAGMIHTVTWRVGSDDALGFWERRLAAG